MRWGFINTEPLVVFDQSADPADLQARVAAMFARILAAAGTHRIVSVELAGAGLGDIFTVRVEYGEVDNALDFSPSGPVEGQGGPGGFACPAPGDLTPVVYMADNVTELAAARTRYYADNAFPADSMVIASEAAGTSQATRFCVLELIAPTSLYTPAASPIP